MRALVLSLALLAGCAGTLDHLRAPEPAKQLEGIRRYGAEQDPSVRVEALAELFRLIGSATPEVRMAAFRALETQKVAGDRRALDLFPAESAPCLILFNVLRSTYAEYEPAEQRHIVAISLRESCTERDAADAWLRERLAQPGALEAQLRDAPDLSSVIRLHDLADDQAYAALPLPLQRYGNAAYVIWMADFYLRGRAGDNLGEYGAVLDEVNAAKAELSTALKAKATGQADADKAVKAAMDKVNKSMERLVELEPGIKPKLDPIREETIAFLLHAAALHRAQDDADLAERVTTRFLAADQLKSAYFIVKWFDELKVDLAEDRRQAPAGVDAQGKIRL